MTDEYFLVGADWPRQAEYEHGQWLKFPSGWQLLGSEHAIALAILRCDEWLARR